MKKKTMTRLLHLLLILGGFLLAIFFCLFLPFYGKEIVRVDPEFAWAFYPCLGWAFAFAIPIFVALAPAWQIFSSISADAGAFIPENAKRLRQIANLALVDAIIFPVGMLVLGYLGAGSAPLTVVITPLTAFLCLAVSLVCYCLSRLVADAAEIRAENDLTV